MRVLRAAQVLALAVLLVTAAGCSRRASQAQMRAWDADLRRLQAEQDSLRARSAEMVARDPRLQSLPKGDVVISVPTSFLRTVIERVFADVADNVTLSLGGLKAHVAKKIKKVVTIGEFTLDVDIQEVVAKLQPGQPDIRFGGDQVSMSLPVAVSEGHGRAKLHFIWDGKNVADMTCGDVDVTRTVTGDVVPSNYLVSGRLKLAFDENRIICTPVFPETRLRIRVEPSPASWDSVKAILETKDGMCGWVLDKVDVPSILEGVVQERGFNVKLPVDKLKPFTLPAGVQDTVKVGARVLTFDTRTNSLRIDPDAIWYSADVTLK